MLLFYLKPQLVSEEFSIHPASVPVKVFTFGNKFKERDIANATTRSTICYMALVKPTMTASLLQCVGSTCLLILLDESSSTAQTLLIGLIIIKL